MTNTGWTGGGGLTLHNNPTNIYGFLDQLSIKSPNIDFLRENIGMFRFNFNTLTGIWGIPDLNKNESLHKTDSCNVLSNC